MPRGAEDAVMSFRDAKMMQFHSQMENTNCIVKKGIHHKNKNKQTKQRDIPPGKTGKSEKSLDIYSQ